MYKVLMNILASRNHTRFSNLSIPSVKAIQFKRYHKLQGSQTSNLKLVITEPILLVIAVIYGHFYFIIKHLSQSII